MHGFALNVNTDLSYFDRIIPCGIFHKGVTSLRQVLGSELPLNELAEKVSHHVGAVFGAKMITHSAEEFVKFLQHETMENMKCLPLENL